MTIVAPAVGAPIGAWYDDITAAANSAAFEPVTAESNTSGTTSSTSYTSTLTGVASPLTLTFTAARTWHMVTISWFVIQGTSGPWTQDCAFSVAGTGYSYAAADADSARGQFTNNNVGSTLSKRTKITGLTIGATYTVTAQYKTSGGTITASYRRLTVE